MQQAILPVSSTSVQATLSSSSADSSKINSVSMDFKNSHINGRRTPVVYIRDDELASYDFSLLIPQHAMKPYRLAATHELVEALGLCDYLKVVKPPRLPLAHLTSFHHPDYLLNLAQHNKHCWEWSPDTSKVVYTGDCPPIEGVLEYSCGIASGSVMAAVLINAQEADTVIHWGGGMHHGKTGDCSGFCFINDIVLCILELLKQHERVLYVDLDVHHGDGVEEAFVATDRVFTLSLHKFGDQFFPGTGSSGDIGIGEKALYTVMNIPLFDGISDFHYTEIFQEAFEGVVKMFSPDAIVLQCGADSLARDRVGPFNLSSVGHGRCVEIVTNTGIPLIVLGGGGYTVKNVARLWAYETSLVIGCPLPQNTRIPYENLPTTGWVFNPHLTLHVAPTQALGYPSTYNATGTFGNGGCCGGSKIPVYAQLNSIRRQILNHLPHIPPHPRE
eukprot:Tbor_TRINITY_DN3544_c0_g1::TRINITY_DN3544_c0_g1_i1::g.2943::m.2943/K06067/HDAC1_2; histone deacetylase 1/2